MNYDCDFHEFSNMIADSILKNINTIRELDRFETYATECGFIDNVIMKINNRRDEIKEFYKKEQIRKQKMKDAEITKKEAERMNIEEIKEDIANRTKLGERIAYELAKGTLSDEVFTEVLMFYISRTGKSAKRSVEELISLENKDRVAFLATSLMNTVDTAREAFNIFIEKDIKAGSEEDTIFRNYVNLMLHFDSELFVLAKLQLANNKKADTIFNINLAMNKNYKDLNKLFGEKHASKIR